MNGGRSTSAAVQCGRGPGPVGVRGGPAPGSGDPDAPAPETPGPLARVGGELKVTEPIYLNMKDVFFHLSRLSAAISIWST